MSSQHVIRRVLVSIATVVPHAVVVLSMGAQIAPPAIDIRADHSWHLSANIRIQVPPAISPREIDRYSELLSLSDAQRAYLDALYSDYRARVASLDRIEGRELVRTANAFAQFYAPQPEYFLERRGWLAAQEGLRDLIATEDERLFLLLAPILAEVQSEGMTRVRLHRQRRQCIPEQYQIRMASIDLASLVESDPMLAEFREPLDGLLDHYERTLTPALVEMDQVMRRSRSLLAKLDLRRRFTDAGRPLDHTSPESQARIADALEEQKSVMAGRGAAQKRVAEINESFLPEFLKQLPAAEARLLLQTWRCQAFPRVYPDPIDPEQMYTEVVRLDVLNDEIRTRIEEQWKVYRTKYAAVCERMEQASRAWHEQQAFTGNTLNWQEHNAAFDEWVRQRDALSGEFAKFTRAMLPAEVHAAADPILDRWAKSVARELQWRGQRGPPHPDLR